MGSQGTFWGNAHLVCICSDLSSSAYMYFRPRPAHHVYSHMRVRLCARLQLSTYLYALSNGVEAHPGERGNSGVFRKRGKGPKGHGDVIVLIYRR